MSDPGWSACVASLESLCGPPGARGASPLAPSQVRYARILWVLCESVDAATILEVGIGPDVSVSGTTFLHWLQHRGGGSLTSIDIDPGLPRAPFRALSERLGVPWTVIHGDSLMVPLPSVAADVISIDGAHDQVHATGDVARYWPLLRPGGYLAFDDYPGCAPGRDVMAVLDSQPIHLAHSPPHGTGHLLVQRRHA